MRIKVSCRLNERAWVVIVWRLFAAGDTGSQHIGIHGPGLHVHPPGIRRPALRTDIDPVLHNAATKCDELQTRYSHLLVSFADLLSVTKVDRARLGIKFDC